MKWLIKILCFIGIHRWDMPGGHCENCGKCDEFFETHQHYAEEGIIVKVYNTWDVILPIEAKNYFDNETIETTTYIGYFKHGNYIIPAINRGRAEEILQEWRNRIK